MSSKKRDAIVFSVFMLIVLTSTALAEDFSAVSQKPVLVACEGSTITDLITIQNTGVLITDYGISYKGTAAPWVALAPISFTLKPEETTNVYDYITPPLGSRGEYDLKIYVTDSLGFTKELSQKLSVRNCLNLDLIPLISSQTACQCSTASYKLRIQNTGTYTENYILSLNPLLKEAVFSRNPVSISPGKSEEVYVYVVMPCSFFGKKEVELKASAQKSGFSTTTLLTFEALPCYDFEIAAAKSYSICNKKTPIPIQIINKDAENSYRIELNGPKWATISTSNLDLGTREAKSIELLLDPKEAGSADLEIEVSSAKGEVTKKRLIKIISQDCYTPEISAKRIGIGYSATKVPLKIRNKGSRQATYVLKLDAPLWMSIEPPISVLKSGETKIIYLKTEPPEDIKEGNYAIKIMATVSETSDIYSKELSVQLKEEKGETKKSLLLYLVMLAPALVILLGLLLIFLLKPKKAEPRERPVIKKAEPEKKIKEKRPKIEVGNALKIYLKKYWVQILILLIVLFIVITAIAKPAYFSKALNVTKLINLSKTEPAITPTQPEIPPIKMDFKPVVEFFSTYAYYIIAGIVILFIWIIITLKPKRPRVKKITGVKRITRVSRKAEEKAEAAKKPRIKIWRLGWYLILAIIFGTAAYAVYHYFSKIVGIARKFFKVPSFLIEIILAYLYYILAGIAILIILVVILRMKKTKEVPEGAEKTPYASYFSWFIGLLVFAAVVYLLIRFVFIPYWIYVILGIAFLIILLILTALLKKMKTKRSEEAVWEEIPTDKEVFMTSKNKRLGFGELIIRVRKRVTNAKIGVTRLRRKPTFMAASEKVYEYYEISKENLENAALKKSILRFKVKKSWLDKNNVEKDQICLKKYTNKWISLPTKAIDADENFVYFESEIGKLGYFAIAAKKTEKEAARASKWPLLALLLILILGGIYYYYAYLAVGEAPPATEKEPVIKKGFTTQEWDEDTILKIDLSEYFYDPDKDALTFTSTKPKNIEVDISNSIAILTPKPNWYGTDYIIFTADDGKGGITSTERITLIVRNVPEKRSLENISAWFKNMGRSIKGFFVTYLAYIGYGLAAAVVLILLIKYNKPILDFFLEEEEDKKKGKKN